MNSGGKKYFAGIDAGSRTTKVVLLNGDSSFVSAIRPTGLNVGETAEKVLAEALVAASAQTHDIQRIVGTGYGRVSLSCADTTVTELSCHALGANCISPDIRMVIDIGGQDSKVIHLDQDGNMVDFIMNDKCAAGTGKFLEMVARTLEMDMDNLSDIHFKGERPCQINSMCVVFVESEIISLIARGESAADIVSGVNHAFANRIGNMAKRLGLKQQCVLTGGVAKNRGLKDALTMYLRTSLTPLGIDPQLNGALGAAVLAQRLSH
ncbi:acyl-CoA dehydratase activase [Desulfofustis glycolicus]|uniref:CoA-substrate-specific enzyme activase, putative n=1 Tax=Desulfofustis glycolicus DSM 9705 TaxID=1121409 RepID=A0A1M5YUG1_9BACT|nr:acyl-CoA dehydratase activase [Desulfofustis glycolicus]MCB2218564.1 2-hydroxyglutaryl-CoA dehydratase [Desulfobulbaceae bacterium]SHI15480.1 CoA-substrate-specific enzyme activase, putative [Desulfofustis glycolicus DSM 9705]